MTPHSVSLITTLAAALGLALLLGFVAIRLRVTALVGYLMAGIILGPFTPGFVADGDIASQLAEIGVMLLMFGVGLHFSLGDLLEVRRIALPGAALQIVVATAMGTALATSWGWSLTSGIVFGLAMSVASTVVLLRALERLGQLRTMNGRIAIGWLLVEDLVMVLALVMLPALAGAGTSGAGLAAGLLGTLAQVGLFIALMLIVGRRLFPWLLWQVARTGSRELFTLCVIAAAIGIAYGAGRLFGVSFALGAFVAGMVLRESDLAYRAAEESLPLRDAFSVLFFVSVGMLFDPRVVLEEPLRLLGVMAIIVLGKSAAAFALVLGFRYPLNTALTVSASLAQIGEFSFILAGLGVSLGLMPAVGQSLILAGAILSIALNPLVFGMIEPVQRWIRSRSGLARALEQRDDPLAQLPNTVSSESVTAHVVIVGYGRVGGRIGERLAKAGVPVVIAEENREIVDGLRSRGVHAVVGDASEPAVLAQAHIARARLLVIATPNTVGVRRMLETARMLNPRIEIVVRTHSEEEAELFRREQVDKVFFAEHELALGMVQWVLERVQPAAARGAVFS
jgi:CPA2 family monovalent cation:H+ antiporter-2